MEIIIETKRQLNIKRRDSVSSGWCAQCAKYTNWVTPEEAVLILNLSSRSIYQRVEQGQVHFYENVRGFLFLCLDSLANEMRQPITCRLLVTELPNYSPLRPLPFPSQPTSGAEPVLTSNGGTGSASEPETRTRRKNRELSQTAFRALLTRLDEDPERAAGRYVELCKRLGKFFECRGCDAPETLADETINRVALRLAEGEEIRSDTPTPYFYGVARNVLREWQEARARQFIPLSELSPTEHPSTYPDEINQELDAQHETEHRLDCLMHCLQELPNEVHLLLLEYYRHHHRARIENRKRMASRLGITVNALKIRIHRLRAKLEKKLNERLRQTATS